MALIGIVRYNPFSWCRQVTLSLTCGRTGPGIGQMSDLPILINHLWREVRFLATVSLRQNESQDSLLKRFRKKVVKSGILSTVRRKRWFISKSENRRMEKKKAIRRSHRKEYE